MKRIALLIFGSIFCVSNSFSQYFAIDTLKDESPYHKQVFFIFPHLSSAANPTAANRIYMDLAKDVLKIEPGQQKRSLFENIWGSAELDVPIVGDISYRVINNDADFFCIGISATGCGAYCEDWTRYYTRESSTGRKITLEALFTGDGLQHLLALINALKVKRIQDNISDLQDGLKTKALSDDDKQDYRTAIDVYGQCLQRAGGTQYLSFSLDKGQVTIYEDHCLPHSIRFLDKVDYTFSFDVSAVKNYLSDYGLSLLKQ